MIQTSFVNLSRNTVPIFLGIDGYDGKIKEARIIFLEEGTHDICSCYFELTALFQNNRFDLW